MTTLLISALLIAMVASLGVGLYHLLKTPDERDKGDKVVKALTWRIAISAVLFGFIILSIKLGWITPSNSVNPNQFNKEQQQRIDESGGKYGK